MITKKQYEQAMRELAVILQQLHAFEEKYGPMLQERVSKGKKHMTEEERNDAAIEMLNKYSSL